MIIATAMALALQIGLPSGGATTQSRSEYENMLNNQADAQGDKRRTPPQPVFTKTPQAEDLQRVYPPEALKNKVSGEATIKCVFDKEGLFTKCKVVSETPAKQGFGAAAVELAKAFKAEPKASDGSSISGIGLTMPLKFNVNMVSQ